jgi:hypothetical protein
MLDFLPTSKNNFAKKFKVHSDKLIIALRCKEFPKIFIAIEKTKFCHQLRGFDAAIYIDKRLTHETTTPCRAMPAHGGWLYGPSGREIDLDKILQIVIPSFNSYRDTIYKDKVRSSIGFINYIRGYDKFLKLANDNEYLNKLLQILKEAIQILVNSVEFINATKSINIDDVDKDDEDDENNLS